MDAQLLHDAYLACLRRRPTTRALKIKHRLLDQRLTIQAIADRVGVSRTMVSLILKGERKGYKHRAKIARMMGLSVEELFGEGRKKAA